MRALRIFTEWKNIIFTQGYGLSKVSAWVYLCSLEDFQKLSYKSVLDFCTW